MSGLFSAWSRSPFGVPRALLAGRVLGLIIAGTAPALAGQDGGRSPSASVTLGQVFQPRLGHHPGRRAAGRLEGHDPRKGAKRAGKARRPHLPPVHAIPARPAAGDNDVGSVPHRSERATASLGRPASVPRQVLIVLDPDQSSEVSAALARKHRLVHRRRS